MKEEYKFDGQRPDEEVIFVSRRHPWVLASAGFIALGLIILTVLLVLFFGFFSITSIWLVALAVFFLIFGFYQWFVYSNYIYILTNQRVILIEQNSLFGRKITEAELEKIQNITVEVKGLVGTLLNFGNITLRTAGVDPIMVMINIENPYEIQQKIIKYCRNYSSAQKPNIIR